MQDNADMGMAAAIGPRASIAADRMALIRQVPDRGGDTWSMLIIAVLEDGPLRYTDLQRQIPGISQRMLTHTLRQLQRDGLITRTAYAEVPPRVEYALGPLGLGLHEIVMQLIGWAAAAARRSSGPPRPAGPARSPRAAVPGSGAASAPTG